MKQKTAIDWLIEELMYESTEMYNHIKDNPEKIEKAKSMFRDQIEEAYKQGCQDTYGNDEPSSSDPEDEKSASDYYQQKYGDEKNTQP